MHYLSYYRKQYVISLNTETTLCNMFLYWYNRQTFKKFNILEKIVNKTKNDPYEEIHLSVSVFLTFYKEWFLKNLRTLKNSYIIEKGDFQATIIVMQGLYELIKRVQKKSFTFPFYIDVTAWHDSASYILVTKRPIKKILKLPNMHYNVDNRLSFLQFFPNISRLFPYKIFNSL